MILTQAELDSLVHTQHRSPHTLLGMHPLGDGSGVVVRAFYPHAAEIEAVPVREKNKPRIKDHQGHAWKTRDPYSFLPTLGEQDLYLFGQGNERRIYDKLGAHLRQI